MPASNPAVALIIRKRAYKRTKKLKSSEQPLIKQKQSECCAIL